MWWLCLSPHGLDSPCFDGCYNDPTSRVPKFFEACPACLTFLQPTFVICSSDYYAGTQSWPQSPHWPEIFTLSFNWGTQLNVVSLPKTRLREVHKLHRKDLGVCLCLTLICCLFLTLIAKKVMKQLQVNFCYPYFRNKA